MKNNDDPGTSGLPADGGGTSSFMSPDNGRADRLSRLQRGSDVDDGMQVEANPMYNKRNSMEL